jgi:predicted metal-dependent hydrolase
MSKIPIRKMPFEFPEKIDPIIFTDSPERSASVVATSLLLPYLEPYLIRTMKAARSHVRDPRLLDDLARFSAQEGQHYRMHMRFNDALRREHLPRLGEFEREISDDYERFTKTRSLRFNLAYAEGFEALTMNSVLFAFTYLSLFDEVDSPVAQLYEWHLIEELEHRTVAFDIYDHVCGGYFYRLAAGTWAQRHYVGWIRRVARYILEELPPRDLGREAAATRKRDARRLRWLALRRFAPMVLRTYMPWYSPHKVAFTAEMQEVSDKYTEMATSIS